MIGNKETDIVETGKDSGSRGDGRERKRKGSKSNKDYDISIPYDECICLVLQTY